MEKRRLKSKLRYAKNKDKISQQSREARLRKIRTDPSFIIREREANRRDRARLKQDPERLAKYKRKGYIRSFSKTWRNKILELLDNKCQECGATENLEIHHLKYEWVDNGSIPEETLKENLHTLKLVCVKCHGREHRE